jgi:uncharacterized coiled-coil protein SlyX
MQSNAELEARIDKLEKTVDELIGDLTKQAQFTTTNSLGIAKLARHLKLMPEEIPPEHTN